MKLQPRVELDAAKEESHRPRASALPESFLALDAQMVAELLDATRNYGTVDLDENVFRLAHPKVLFSASCDEKNRTLIVNHPSGRTGGSGIHIFALHGDDHGFVFWDKSVTLDDAIEVVMTCDRAAYDYGLIDETGPRVAMNLAGKNLPKKLVARVCMEKNWKNLNGSREYAERFVAGFDNPSALMITSVGYFDIFYVCHKDNEKRIRQEVEVFGDIMRKHNIPEKCQDSELFTTEICIEVDDALKALE